MSADDQYQRISRVAGGVNAICQPFLKKYQLSYFSYGHMDTDGTFCCLVTNPNWYQNFRAQKYPIFIPSAKDASKDSYFYLWDEVLPKQVTADALKNFKMAKGITLVSKQENGRVQYFAFASSSENLQAISSYFTNLNTLLAFTGSFLDDGKELIREVTNHPLLLPPEKKQLIESSVAIRLTPRELACIQYLQKCYTVKEIAQVLQLSPRTIEDRLNSIKEKLGCGRKSQIIKSFESIQVGAFL